MFDDLYCHVLVAARDPRVVMFQAAVSSTESTQQLVEACAEADEHKFELISCNAVGDTLIGGCSIDIDSVVFENLCINILDTSLGTLASPENVKCGKVSDNKVPYISPRKIVVSLLLIQSPAMLNNYRQVAIICSNRYIRDCF